MPGGGYFAVFQEPAAFADEVLACTRVLRT